MMRYFKFVNHLTMPRTLRPGLGNTHVRPVPGDTIAIDEFACAKESRFINGRKRAGDMVEIKEAAHSESTCAYAKHIAVHAAHAADLAAKASPADATPAADVAVKGK